MHNLLEILIFTLTNFTKLPILRYLCICNVLHIRHIRAIPFYRVYWLYDYGTLVTRNYIPSKALWNMNAEYCIAHSRAWATGRVYAVLINFSEFQIYTSACIVLKITDWWSSKLFTVPHRGGESETELIVNSTVQGPSKNTIDRHAACSLTLTTEAAKKLFGLLAL